MYVPNCSFAPSSKVPSTKREIREVLPTFSSPMMATLYVGVMSCSESLSDMVCVLLAWSALAFSSCCAFKILFETVILCFKLNQKLRFFELGFRECKTEPAGFEGATAMVVLLTGSTTTRPTVYTCYLLGWTRSQSSAIVHSISSLAFGRYSQQQPRRDLPLQWFLPKTTSQWHISQCKNTRQKHAAPPTFR